MAGKEANANFPEQLQESRKKIRDCFKRSHEALQMREVTLLYRVDEIEREHNSMNQKMAKLVESLKQHSSLSSDTPTDNELNETYQQIYSVIDTKIKSLKQQTLTSIEFEWDTQFEPVIEQLGSIKVNGQTSKPPNFPPGVKPVVPDYESKQIPSVSCCKSSNFKVPGELNGPRGIAVHLKTGNVYVADMYNHRVQVFSSNGDKLFIFDEKMNLPYGICMSRDQVFVSQYNGHCVNVYQLKGDLIRSVGTRGKGAVQFTFPQGIDISNNDNSLYVCEKGNARVQVLTEEFKSLCMLGDGDFQNPLDVRVTRDRVLVLDDSDPCIFIFDSEHDLINRIITRGYGKQIFNALYFDIDKYYNLIMSDCHNHCVFVFNREGELIHKFGKEGQGTGEFYHPYGVALDNTGRIIVVCSKKANCLQFF